MMYEEKVKAEFEKARPIIDRELRAMPRCEKAGAFKICRSVCETQEEFYHNGPINILIMGDSVSHGCVGGAVSNDYHTVYHNRLRLMIQHAYPNYPINAINVAVGGVCAPYAAERVVGWLDRYRPELAIVCFGLNDVNGEEQTYTDALAAIFRACADAGVDCLFMTPNMLNTYVSEYTFIAPEYAPKTAAYQRDGRMDDFMEAARKTAAEYGVPVFDGYAIWKRLAEEGVDTTLLLANLINHPIRSMHDLFATGLYQTIFGTSPNAAAVSHTEYDGMIRL